MDKGELIYEGKAKKVFETERSDWVIQYFKDDATAFNAQKRGSIVDKGVVNNKVSERLFLLLEKGGVPTHFVKRLSDREMGGDPALLQEQEEALGEGRGPHPFRQTPERPRDAHEAGENHSDRGGGKNGWGPRP